MSPSNKIVLTFVCLIVCACNQTSNNSVEIAKPTFPLDTENITDISLDTFITGSDSMIYENIYKLNKVDYSFALSNINSSKKITDPKVNLNVEIVIVYRDNKKVKILSNSKYFSIDNKTFYSFVDTLFIPDYIDRMKAIKQCVK